jgi:hypothetical protein
MRRLLAFATVTGLVITLGALARGWWPVAIGIGMMSASWPLLRCRHPGRLGLLPPVSGPDGSRVPARWYCDRCGRSWPAGIAHGPAPLQRFSGYDEAKAVRAAERARELEASQRELAVRRSGVAAPATTASGSPSPKKRTVPFGPRRRPETLRGRLAG